MTVGGFNQKTVKKDLFVKGNYGILPRKQLRKDLEDTTPKLGPNGHESGPADPSPRPASLLWSSFALCRVVCVSKIYTVNLRWFIFGGSNGDRGN